MDKKKVIKELIVIFWIFIIGSIIGYIYEMIVVLLQKGYFESRQGLVYGPFTPVYGIGGIAYYTAFRFIKTRNKGKVFIITMILRRSNRVFGILYSRKGFWNNIMGLFLSFI